MKNNYSLIVAYIGLFIMYYSGFCDAMVVNGNGIKLYTITGFAIAALTFIIYIYGITTNKKIIYIISFIITLLSYLYSGYLILLMSVLGKTLVENTEVAIYASRLGYGSYLYTISFVFLIISIFIPKNDKNIPNKQITPLDKEINNNQPNNYIFCKYIYGCKELNSNKNGVIRINENNTLSIIVLDNENKVTEKIINYNDITDINIRSSIVLSEEPSKINNNTVANTVLATTILGGGLTSYAISSFINQAESYNKMKEKVIYDINIVLQAGTILVQTKNNPQEFISIINIKKI